MIDLDAIRERLAVNRRYELLRPWWTDDIAVLLAEVDRLRAIEQRIRALHSYTREQEWCPVGCGGDATLYPCETVRLLDGEIIDD